MGLVSGENAFFLLNRNTVDEYQLANSTRMVIGRTEQLKGVILSERDFKTLIENGKKVYNFKEEDAITLIDTQDLSEDVKQNKSTLIMV